MAKQLHDIPGYRRARGINWSTGEDAQLCESWSATCEKAFMGNDQRSREFWNVVEEDFNENYVKNYQLPIIERADGSHKLRFGVIAKSVNKFCKYYHTCLYDSSTGEKNLIDALNKAMKMYKDEEGKDSKGFMFLHCWKILEKSYGWLNRPGVVKMKQSERRVARIIPNESDDDEYPAVHPAEITSIGERPAQPKMVEIRPAQPTVAEERPAESRMVEERPAEPIVVDERPTEPNVIEERPTEAIVVDELPMGGNIIEESKCDEKLDLATILQEFVASNEKKIKLAEEKMRWKRDREILMTDPSTITFKRYRTYIEKKQDDIMDRMLEEDLMEEDNRRQSFYTPPVSTHDTDSIENDDGPAWRTSLNNSIGALKDELEDKKADIAKAEQKLGIMKQLL